MGEPRARRDSGPREILGPVTIHRPGEVRVSLGAVDGGVGGRVDDQIRLRSRHGLAHGGGVADVHIDLGNRLDVPAVRRRRHELGSQLSTRSGDQRLHATPSERTRVVPYPTASWPRKRASRGDVEFLAIDFRDAIG